MSRADDRGCTATTRVLSAPRVTLNWLAEPFTSRGIERTKWIREKNGRRVLQTTSTGGGRAKYWRAPRPRPREHRRRKRGEKKAVVKAALAQHSTLPTSTFETHVAVQVLQHAFKDALQREADLKRKLQEEASLRLKLQQQLARIQEEQEENARRVEGHATAQQNQQSYHRCDDFGVCQGAHAQMPPAVSDAELVQCIAWPFGMFVLGCYCHYTFSKLVP